MPRSLYSRYSGGMGARASQPYQNRLYQSIYGNLGKMPWTNQTTVNPNNTGLLNRRMRVPETAMPTVRPAITPDVSTLIPQPWRMPWYDVQASAMAALRAMLRERQAATPADYWRRYMEAIASPL